MLNSGGGMEELTIFYSWQSDSPGNTNRTFLKTCLEDAIKQLLQEGHVEAAPRVDHDMKGVHGDEDVVATIFRKIEQSDIFVADVTIVAKTDKGKQVPNPNVLLELGYALKEVGSRRIIKVMNEAYGCAEDGLPFDMQHKRWPIRYTLPSAASKADRERTQNQLVKELAGALRGILQAEGRRAENMNLIMETPPAWKSSCFAPDGQLGIYLYQFEDESHPINWQNGPQWFLRVIPHKGLTGATVASLAECARISQLRPFGQQCAPNRLNNQWGSLTFQFPMSGKPTQHLTQLFETGELWGIECIPKNSQNDTFLPFPFMWGNFIEMLENYLIFVQEHLKLAPPLKIIAGVSGINGYRLADNQFPPPKCLGGMCPKDEILYDAILTSFDKEDQLGFLTGFFQKVWAEFGLTGYWRR